MFQKRWRNLLIGAGVAAFFALAYIYLQNDIHNNQLDPKLPFQVYKPPAAPDYKKADSWYLNPAIAGYYADPRKVDVFFLHATSYNGGKDWLGSISKNKTEDEVTRVQLPNYAAPFAIMGNIYAPKYRQASLYTQLTFREDAREARQFAYGDAESAFKTFLKTRRGGKGFVIVGLEQGGLLAERLIRDKVAPYPELKAQLVAAYLLETAAPESQYGMADSYPPICASRQNTGCVVAYMSLNSGRPDIALQILRRAAYWQDDVISSFGSQKSVCVNPLTGSATKEDVDARRSLGATNATGLEWGTDPALSARKVSAHCIGGLLFVNKPVSLSFNESGTWEDKRKVNKYNLFYGDLQADIQARWQAYQAATDH